MTSPKPLDSSLPSPFDDEAVKETYPTDDTPCAQSPAHVVDPLPQWPDTVSYTVYEESDVCGGI